MNIAIIGATGFIGSSLTRRLLVQGFNVTAVSRKAEKVEKLFQGKAESFQWDGKAWEGLLPLVEDADIIVNLAGENISSGRWTDERKSTFRESRVGTGEKISKAIEEASKKPSMLIQASATGIYGVNYIGTNTKLPGDDSYLANLTADWENSVSGVKKAGVKIAIIRLGVVLGKGSGILGKVITPMKLFAGGHLGNGKQWMSWIHIDDVTGAIEYIIENKLEGEFNLTSPEPLMQKDFFKILGKTISRPSWLHVPSFVLKLMFGKMADETILASQRVMPDRLLEAGFSFSYPSAESALKQLLLS